MAVLTLEPKSALKKFASVIKASVGTSTFHHLLQTSDDKNAQSFLEIALVSEFFGFRNHRPYNRCFFSTALWPSKMHISKTNSSRT